MNIDMNSALYEGFTKLELQLPLRGLKKGIAYAYIAVNIVGFAVNLWVLWIVMPILLLWRANRVPQSILLYILGLCFSDLAVMIAMVFLNIELLYGSWGLGGFACTSYLLFDSLNKFVAPIIVFLISRSCYASICLGGKQQSRALKLWPAAIQLTLALLVVLLILSPLILYSKWGWHELEVFASVTTLSSICLLCSGRVYPIVLRVNESTQEITFVRKCSFAPPPVTVASISGKMRVRVTGIELTFNVIATVCSYAIPFVGFLYCYASVPYFLWKRREQAATGSLLAGENYSRLSNIVLGKVVSTVSVLAAIYLICWTPYWIGLYAHHFFHSSSINSTKRVLMMYTIHLLPYISCIAYPAIFTTMNRAIQTAHKEFVDRQRRRLKNPMASGASRAFSKLKYSFTSNGRRRPLRESKSGHRRTTVDCVVVGPSASRQLVKETLPRVTSFTTLEHSRSQ